MAAELSGLGYFLSIFAFLLVFIVVYAILMKTKVLGDGNPGMMLFISFLLASFFVVQTSLVDFVQFTSAWFGVIVVVVFFLFLILAFIPVSEPLSFLAKGNWFSWVLFGLMVGFFIVASSYVFGWVVNWNTVGSWLDSEWFGLVLLLIIALVVSWKIKVKG